MSLRIRTTAIVGAGVMGQGIAQLCAVSGFGVILFDQREGAAARALDAIRKSLDTLQSKGKLTEDPNIIAARISSVDNVEEVRADLIIEAIIELLEPKQALFATLEELNPGAILATNTSTFPVTEISARLKQPARAVGLHFFNPAPVMKLVEVIASKHTSGDTLSVATDFATRLGKNAVLAKDSPGFIVNRVARPYYLESLKALEDNAAGHTTIDKLLKATGFRMGPFELMDVIGIDTNLAVTTSMYAAFNEAVRFKPNRIQQEKVAAGLWGKKSGRGFYDYTKS